MTRLVLASASSQRRSLLEGLGLQFEIVPSEVDEEDCAERDPAVRAVQLAGMKAQDVARNRPDAWVVGCDTLVVASDGTLFEKPATADQARAMIRAYAGTSCVVHSGLALRAPDGRSEEGLSTSTVWFKRLAEEDIDWWIGTGLWQDRSGGFQIDGPGQLLIERIDGDWSSIVGFPVFLFGQLSKKLEAPFPFTRLRS